MKGSSFDIFIGRDYDGYKGLRHVLMYIYTAH